MTSYQNAVQALKQCVKDAIDNDVNPSLQSEIWRHYQGMKAIAEQIPERKTEYTFSINDEGSISISSGYYDPDSNINFAADTVPLDFGDSYGRDVITFS
jgi:hypothetical protein